MANSYFKFKQFTIHQDKCAMKVCTDACLFGALVSKLDLKNYNCLDIGTGTGLLSLMVAQHNDGVRIHAVEIDPEAAIQAADNINASPWAANIQVLNTDVLALDPAKQYDCIFSNPPFFEDDLPAPDAAKNEAKHSTSLNLSQLLQFVHSNLSANGLFAVLLPFHRVDIFIDQATNINLFLNRKILVKHTLKHRYFRGILFFSRTENVPTESEIIIKDLEQNYTPEFSALLKDFYLFL